MSRKIEKWHKRESLHSDGQNKFEFDNDYLEVEGSPTKFESSSNDSNTSEEREHVTRRSKHSLSSFIDCPEGLNKQHEHVKRKSTSNSVGGDFNKVTAKNYNKSKGEFSLALK